MATVTDNFSGTLGNWTTLSGYGGAAISGGHLVSAAGATSRIIWTASSFGADQFAELTITDLAGFYGGGVIVRRGGTDYYELRVNFFSANIQLYKRIFGAEYSIQDFGAVAVTPCTLRLEVSGNTLKAFQNGVQLNSDVASGGELTSGQIGAMIYEDPAYTYADNFSGGDLSGGLTTAAGSAAGVATVLGYSPSNIKVKSAFNKFFNKGFNEGFN